MKKIINCVSNYVFPIIAVFFAILGISHFCHPSLSDSAAMNMDSIYHCLAGCFCLLSSLLNLILDFCVTFLKKLHCLSSGKEPDKK